MEETARQKIGPCPTRCHYRRCWCTWWIVPNHVERYLFCPACGVDKKIATQADYDAARLEYVEPAEEPSLAAENHEAPRAGSTFRTNKDDELW